MIIKMMTVYCNRFFDDTFIWQGGIHLYHRKNPEVLFSELDADKSGTATWLVMLWLSEFLESEMFSKMSSKRKSFKKNTQNIGKHPPCKRHVPFVQAHFTSTYSYIFPYFPIREVSCNLGCLVTFMGQGQHSRDDELCSTWTKAMLGCKVSCKQIGCSRCENPWVFPFMSRSG